MNRTTDVALPQSVEAGDARVDVGSNSVQIVASDVEVGNPSPMKLSSSVFTPNGDEINEDARVSFDLFSVNGGTPAWRRSILRAKRSQRFWNNRRLQAPTAQFGTVGTAAERPAPRHLLSPRRSRRRQGRI